MKEDVGISVVMGSFYSKLVADKVFKLIIGIDLCAHVQVWSEKYRDF